MKDKRYILANVLIEVDTTHMSHFTEADATTYFNSALKLGSIGQVERLDIYILASKPGSMSDIVVEDYIYRGLKIEIIQEASTVGSERPIYFGAVFNPNVKNPTGTLIGDGSESVTDVKRAAEKHADKWIARLEKQGKTIYGENT